MYPLLRLKIKDHTHIFLCLYINNNMNRLLELIILLVVIILISTFASSVNNKEMFATPAPSIESVSSDLVLSGFADVASSPTSNIRSFVALVPTLDDLLSTNYLQPQYSQGLAGTNSIYARSCGDKKGTIFTEMDSNKDKCGVMVDLQAYKLKSTSLRLKVRVVSNPNSVFVVPDEKFVNLLMLRPVFLTIDGSQPYCLDFTRNTPYMFTTVGIPTVNVYNKFPTDWMELPLKRVQSTNSNFFPVQTRDLPTVLSEKGKIIANITGNHQKEVVEVDVVVYYVERVEKFGSTLKLPDTANSTSFSNNAYISKIVSQIQSPTAPLTVFNVNNPTISVTFSISVATPTDTTQPAWWTTNWQPILSIAGNGTSSSCDSSGRGILHVEMRPTTFRMSNNFGIPFNEITFNTMYYCLDFTNVEDNSATGQIVDGCGGINRSILWLPVGVKVDIAYIVSPTMKVIAAKYYDPTTKRRELTFVHLFNTGSNINDIYNCITQVPDLTVWNNIKRYNMDQSTFNLSNIEVSYGMKDLYNWYRST